MTLMDPTPRHNLNPEWNDETLQKLRDLADQGLSTRQIAAKLGFATRNAIIGKMHRLGIFKTKIYDKPQHLRPQIARVKPTQKHPVNPQMICEAHIRHHRVRPTFPDTDLQPPTHFDATTFDRSIPQKQRKTLLELNEHTCHWPVGDVHKPNFFFCGAPTDGIYCPHHYARSVRA